MRNNTGDPQYNAVCSTVTDTVALVLRFLQNYLVIDQEDNPDLATLDISNQQAIGDFCDTNKYDEILYGSTDLNEGGGFIFRLQVFNNQDQATKAREEVVADSVFDVFDSADRITARIISHISNVHIGFGSIALNLEGPESEYTVYLDGRPVRNPRQLFRKVLNGTYVIEIHQDRLLGDTVIFKKQIDVFEDKTTQVNFSIPLASAGEKQLIESKKEEILATADDPAKISELVQSIVAFQEQTLKVDYDRSLKDLIDRSLSELGSKAGSILVERVKDADSKYFAKRPDFNAARSGYESISKIVNDTFDFRTAKASETDPISEPYAVRAAPNGYFYSLDGSRVNNLRAFDEKGDQVAFVKLDSEGRLDRYSLATDAESRLYCFDAANGKLTVYNPQLQPLQVVEVPGFKPAGGVGAAVAVSDDQEVYVIGKATVTAFPYDPDTPAEIERDAFIEDAVQKGLADYPDFVVSEALVDSQNHLNLFSITTKELLVFGKQGNLLRRVPLSSAVLNSGIACDKLGYLYMTIPEVHKVAKYGPDGAFVTSFGQYGVGAGDFAQPHGIAVRDNYDLIVADYFNNRLEVVHPVSPPILLPEVSRYGILVNNRVDAAERAETTVKNVGARIRPLRSVGELGGSLLSFGAAFGLALANDYFARTSVSYYSTYTTATDTTSVESARSSAELHWAASQTALLGTYAAIGTGAALLTQSLAATLDAPGIRREAIQGLQSISLDYSYGIDDKLYRGLRRAQNIGIWTGIVPPIAGLAAAIGGPAIVPGFDAANIPYIAMGAVALPPIFSHMYAKRFSPGLVVTGLVADLLAVTSYFVAAGTTIPSDAPVRYADPQTTLTGAWTATISPSISTYLAVAALSVRLAAGIYDAQKGWVAALDYNEFKARKQTAPILQAMVVPYTDGKAIGLLCSLEF
jgi:hypothetical protein